MEGLIEKTAEKLGVGYLAVFERAGKENSVNETLLSPPPSCRKMAGFLFVEFTN